ncbi:MAG: hypothetical protein HY722_00020 [Planctomycetes bacterium]|nr:hypothetical protein [Planctomycetota bacterium]
MLTTFLAIALLLVAAGFALFLTVELVPRRALAAREGPAPLRRGPSLHDASPPGDTPPWVRSAPAPTARPASERLVKVAVRPAARTVVEAASAPISAQAEAAPGAAFAAARPETFATAPTASPIAPIDEMTATSGEPAYESGTAVALLEPPERESVPEAREDVALEEECVDRYDALHLLMAEAAVRPPLPDGLVSIPEEEAEGLCPAFGLEDFLAACAAPAEDMRSGSECAETPGPETAAAVATTVEIPELVTMADAAMEGEAAEGLPEFPPSDPRLPFEASLAEAVEAVSAAVPAEGAAIEAGDASEAACVDVATVEDAAASEDVAVDASVAAHGAGEVGVDAAIPCFPPATLHTATATDTPTATTTATTTDTHTDTPTDTDTPTATTTDTPTPTDTDSPTTTPTDTPAALPEVVPPPALLTREPIRPVTLVGLGLGPTSSAVADSSGLRHRETSAVGYPHGPAIAQMIGLDRVVGTASLGRGHLLDLRFPLQDPGVDWWENEDEAAARRKSIQDLVHHMLGQVEAEEGCALHAVVALSATIHRLFRRSIESAVRERCAAAIFVPEPYAIAQAEGVVDCALIVSVDDQGTHLCAIHGTLPRREHQALVRYGDSHVEAQLSRALAARVGPAAVGSGTARALLEHRMTLDEEGGPIIHRFTGEAGPTTLDVASEVDAAVGTLVVPLARGIARMVSGFDPEFQETLRGRILLTGTGARYPGLGAALEGALASLGRPRVRAVADSSFAAALGALALASEFPAERWQRA